MATRVNLTDCGIELTLATGGETKFGKEMIKQSSFVLITGTRMSKKS